MSEEKDIEKEELEGQSSDASGTEETPVNENGSAPKKDLPKVEGEIDFGSGIEHQGVENKDIEKSPIGRTDVEKLAREPKEEEDHIEKFQSSEMMTESVIENTEETESIGSKISMEGKTEVPMRRISDQVVEHSGFSFFVIDQGHNLNVDQLQYHNALIVDGKDLDFIRQIVKRVRSHNSPDIYLKPIFILKGINIADPMINSLIDGTLFSLDQLDFIIPEVERILTRIGDLKFTNSISFEAQMIEKIICYLYTCERYSLEPIPYTYSDINYSYPILSVNFRQTDEHTVLDILDIAEQEGIFESEYYDRIYLCSNCSSGHLSYREVCPKCGSSNSQTEDIIHHFPCGYVGPLRDFTNEIDDQLDCPKCNKRLRHIGVDYDKPSVLHECKNCSHKFQDYNVKAKCLSCQTDNGVETLAGKEVRSFTLTKKGELAAINGFVTTSKDIDEIIGTVKFEFFKTMLKYEIERLRQTEGSSNVCAIHIINPSQVYSKIGSEVQKGLLKDIVKVIRSNIRSSDVISFQSSSTIVLSMNEIPYKISIRILKEIIQILKRLMATAFNNMEVEFEYKVVQLDYKLSPELHIHQLTKDFG